MTPIDTVWQRLGSSLILQAYLQLQLFDSLPQTMGSKCKCIAALSGAAPLTLHEIPRRPVGKKDVKITIKYAGICHSDIHQAREEWGKGIFPMVPGHEIAGVVESVGAEVTKYKVGDSVGVGCMVDSCRGCGACKAGDENYCATGAVDDLQWQVQVCPLRGIQRGWWCAHVRWLFPEHCGG